MCRSCWAPIPNDTPRFASQLDDMYKGEYRGKPRHPADLPGVLERGWAAGVKRIIITAGNLQEAKAALELVCAPC